MRYCCTTLVFWLISLLASGQVPYDMLLFGELEANNRGSASVVVNDTVWFAGTASDGVDGSDDIALYCFAPDGSLIFEERYGDGRNEFVNNMILCSDGNLYIVGDVRDQYTDDLNGFLLSVDLSGNILWRQDHGVPELREDFYNIDCLESAAVAVTGFISDTVYSGNNILLARYSTAGDLLSTATFGDTLNDYGMGIVCLPGGNILISGDRLNTDEQYSAFCMKVDPDDAVLFDVPVTAEYNSGCKNMHADSDSTVLICGESASAIEAEFDVIVVRMDTSGNVLLSQQYLYPGPQAAYDIVPLPEGRFAITGFGFNPDAAENDMLYMLCSENAEEITRIFYGELGSDLGYDIQADTAGNVWMSGFMTVEGHVRFALVFNEPYVSVADIQASPYHLFIAPNPVTSCFTTSGLITPDEVQLFGLDGKYLSALVADANHFCLPTGLPAGVYILQYKYNGIRYSQKIIAG